jgi:uncharacterized membrane protein
MPYNKYIDDLRMWKKCELAHVGRIAAMQDKDLQYSYALSTVNGMVHLRDAIFERVTDPACKNEKAQLLQMHDDVVRVIQHLIKDYQVNLKTIKAFNTRHILKSFNYLKKTGTRKNKRT